MMNNKKTKPIMKQIKEKTLAIITLFLVIGMLILVGTAIASWVFRGAF